MQLPGEEPEPASSGGPCAAPTPLRGHTQPPLLEHSGTAISDTGPTLALAHHRDWHYIGQSMGYSRWHLT